MILIAIAKMKGGHGITHPWDMDSVDSNTKLRLNARIKNIPEGRKRMKKQIKMIIENGGYEKSASAHVNNGVI